MTAWQTAALSDVLTDAKPGFACGEDPSDGVFQFRMNNITIEGQIDCSKKRRVPRDTRRLDSFVVEPGDVLFNATNSPELVGKSAFFPGLDEPAVFSNHFLRLRPHKDKLDGRYLARWLVLQFQRGVFQGMCRQWVNQATVNRDSLLALRLPLPTLPEQRRMAEVLDRAEALRAKRRAAIAQIDTLTRSIFLNLFGDGSETETAGERVRLESITSRITKGTTPTSIGLEFADRGVPFIRVQNLKSGSVDWEADVLFISSQTHGTLSRSQIQVGDVLVSIAGTIGRVAVVPRLAPEMNCNQAVAIVRPTGDVIREYLVHWLQGRSAQRQMLGAQVIGTISNLSLTQLRGIKLPVPPVTLQREFARRITVVEELKAAYRASLAELDTLFGTLQHRAFRGEL